MKPYYADESVTLYHGRCEDVLPDLEPAAAHVLLTDPPYFQVKDDEWDNQWQHATQFLGWLGDVLDAAKPALTANASSWVFAGPALASKVEGVVGERFRVLNHVRWVKEQGWHQKAEIEAQRRYLTPWEGIVFAEQHGSDAAANAEAGWEAACSELHKRVFAPLGQYLKGEWERAGWKAGRLGVALGYDSALPTRWAEGSSLPSPEGYRKLRNLLGDGYLARDLEDLRREYEDLRREYEDLRREYEDLRRPFNLKRIGPTSDVWNFDTVAPYAGKHPCEKPQALLRHMIDVSSRPGDLILDPFAGSGSTLIAARDAGRRAIGIEMDPDYCRRIASRLEQGVLDFGDIA